VEGLWIELSAGEFCLKGFQPLDFVSAWLLSARLSLGMMGRPGQEMGVPSEGMADMSDILPERPLLQDRRHRRVHP
jgi:hypothetical protein